MITKSDFQLIYDDIHEKVYEAKFGKYIIYMTQKHDIECTLFYDNAFLQTAHCKDIEDCLNTLNKLLTK